MRAKLAGLTALACVLGVAACSDRDDDGDSRGMAGICTPFAAAATAPTDPSGVSVSGGGDGAAFDDCLHRWGYRLAGADDTADIVAQAVVAACAPALSRWNQSNLAQVQEGSDTAVSLVTGESQTTFGERYQMAQNKALFYVVQGRAGSCSAPDDAAPAAAR